MADEEPRDPHIACRMLPGCDSVPAPLPATVSPSSIVNGMSDSTYTLVTDGACSGNGTDAARGGWAAILTAPDGRETVLTGGEIPTTNNRMELTAALEGLREAPEGSLVDLVTDSSYVANAILKGWLDGWQRRGWRTASKQPVANRDLWERMILELRRHRTVRPILVRGHAGHEANERADRLAQQAAADAEPGPSATAAAPPVRDAGSGQLGFDL
jgi:ribonuclease HI